MLDLPYLFFRGAVGFSLVVVGIAFFFDRSRNPATRALGVLFPSVGLLFCISATDSWWPLPGEVGNLAVIVLVFAVSQALFELNLFLFGDARIGRHKRHVYLVGAGLSVLVWALPLLDYAFSGGASTTSVEDGQRLGPIHTFLGPVIYGWPIAVTLLSLRLGQWRLRDLSWRLPGLRVLLVGLGFLAGILFATLLAVAAGSEGLYRVAQTALELLMLAWYFYLNRVPDHFDRLRDAVGERHERIVRQEASEWELLAERLTKVVEDGTVLRTPRLNLAVLSSRLGVPAYLLSRYFNQRMGTTFSAWLNVQRISWVCRRMAEDSEAKILDLAFEAGYNSKSTFNLQFSKILGMSPSEYRTSQIPEFSK